MAGDWIKWCKGLANKPETVRLASLLGISRDSVIVKLMTFWEWCDENIPDDAIEENGSAFVTLSPSRGDNVAFVDALVGTPKFADSLAVVNWLRFRDDRLELPNFGRHNGETAKTRARNAKNQNKKRSKGDSKTGLDRHIDVTEMSPSSGDKTVTREEKRREEENTEEKASASPAVAVEKPRTHHPPKPKTPRPRDELFDAIAEVTGSDQKASGGHVGKVTASLRGADPPYTPDEVRRWAEVKHAEGWLNGHYPTLGLLEKTIGIVRAKAPAAAKGVVNARGNSSTMGQSRVSMPDGKLDDYNAKTIRVDTSAPAKDAGEERPSGS